MPVYDYLCVDHGAFDRYRPMSESSMDADCPTCGVPAARMVTAPNLRLMAQTTRSAMDRNEKSRHAPHVHTSVSGHTHAGPKSAVPEKPRLQSYTGPRPWVMEHR